MHLTGTNDSIDWGKERETGYESIEKPNASCLHGSRPKDSAAASLCRNHGTGFAHHWCVQRRPWMSLSITSRKEDNRWFHVYVSCAWAWEY
jgi:hypothetical protein